MSSNLAIKVENLSKCYHIYSKPQDRLLQMLSLGRRQYSKEFWALRDVSFSIQKGETIGIIGRNGSGKSTLLQMICGTVTPTTGSVQTNGRVAALLELGAGFNTEFTGRENIFLNAAILGFTKEQMVSRIDEILRFSELENFIDQPVKTYSSGMYARLAFSIAIHVDPDILIIDEALAVGDARFVAKCMRRIKDMQKLGVTILFVSHDVGSVRTLCERVIWLNKGRLVEEGEVFPVSGRYMEFMFKDDKTDEDALRETIVTQLEHASPEENVTTHTETSVPILLDDRPVTHWGSHKGMICAAGIYDTSGIRKEVYLLGTPLVIRIDVRIPLDISREHLCVAFSIKDLKGTDLIVSSTYDLKDQQMPDKEYFCVTFKLNNALVTGKYLLVAAVENRQYNDIHYYEYVEGAHYFSSLADQNFFGLFQPLIEQQVTPA